MTPIVASTKVWVQPDVKVRGREYLRIIDGPEYTDPANLSRLRQRGLGHKRSLALREFALGIEGLHPVQRTRRSIFIDRDETYNPTPSISEQRRSSRKTVKALLPPKNLPTSASKPPSRQCDKRSGA